MRTIASAFWRRLDVPGHDTCNLFALEGSYQLAGTAVFREGAEAAALNYEVSCDPLWRAINGRVFGTHGSRVVDVLIERTPSHHWRINGRGVEAVTGCIDLDYGFTPATNILQIKRMSLDEGDTTALSVAWFDLSSDTLISFPQRYERRDHSRYWYESPTVDYKAELEMSPGGFVAHYPRLWLME